MEAKKIFNVFFREKPVNMLLNMKNSKGDMYASSLAKKIDCTYSHVVKVLQEMHRSGLVNYKKQGRQKILTLTAQGSKVAEFLESIKNLL